METSVPVSDTLVVVVVLTVLLTLVALGLTWVATRRRAANGNYAGALRLGTWTFIMLAVIGAIEAAAWIANSSLLDMIIAGAFGLLATIQYFFLQDVEEKLHAETEASFLAPAQEATADCDELPQSDLELEE